MPLMYSEYYSKIMQNRLHPCCMAMLSWSDLEGYLQRHGWVLVRSIGRDKIYEKQEPGQPIRRAAVSKGTGEIGKEKTA